MSFGIHRVKILFVRGKGKKTKKKGERPGLGCMKRRGLGLGRDRFQVEEILVGFNIVIEKNFGLSEVP